MAARWVRDEMTASDWILGQAEHTLAALDIPVFGRLYVAWESADLAAVARWSRFLQASQESAELRAEDRDIGAVAAGLGIASARHETQYTRLFRS